MLVSALNESPERIGLKYARKVFVDAFFRHRRGFEVEVPTVPLGRLYGPELHAWLEGHGVRLLLGQGVQAVPVRQSARSRELELRDGTTLEAELVPGGGAVRSPARPAAGELVEARAGLRQPRRLEVSPITSVHLWYDRRSRACRTWSWWAAWASGCSTGARSPRGALCPGGRQCRRRSFAAWATRKCSERIVEELARLFPGGRHGYLRTARVVTEHAATFSVVPGVDRWRPAQASPIRNLFVAGDWTATGWPATMEGAVRSGYLAAEALLARQGIHVRLLQPDL